jgi:hypothetical protein
VVVNSFVDTSWVYVPEPRVQLRSGKLEKKRTSWSPDLLIEGLFPRNSESFNDHLLTIPSLLAPQTPLHCKTNKYAFTLFCNMHRHLMDQPHRNISVLQRMNSVSLYWLDYTWLTGYRYGTVSELVRDESIKLSYELICYSVFLACFSGIIKLVHLVHLLFLAFPFERTFSLNV